MEINVFSVDLEDWFCSHNFSRVIPRERWQECEFRVLGSTHLLLNLLAKHHVEATFFVLGWIAERAPHLVREIEAAGHEVACHGYSHRLLTEMTPHLFEEDLVRAVSTIQPLIKRNLLGFRAPSFSVTAKTIWAFDILKGFGFRYDSSIFPIGFHPEYGMPQASLTIHDAAEDLVEVPLTCVEVARLRVPCAGGAYFRFLPYAITRRLFDHCNYLKRPIVFYVHPWEVDPGQPRVKLPLSKRLRHYYSISKTLTKLDWLLSDFRFTSVKRLLGL